MSDSSTETARGAVERAERGDPAAEPVLDKARAKNPEDAQAVEQESADGPEGRGLSR